MTRSLKDPLDFGKHKGKLIEDVYKEDASYLCWARDWLGMERGDPYYFDTEVHQLLDMTIREDKYLKRRFKPWDLQTGVRTDPAAAVPESSTTPAYEAWGSF